MSLSKNNALSGSKRIKRLRWFLIPLSVALSLAVYASGLLVLYSYRCQTLSSDRPIFSTKRVVFYPQHQDDETLWAGGAIRNAVVHQGPQNVYVVLVSSGTGLNFFKNPLAFQNFVTKHAFAQLSPEEQFRIRTDEFRHACTSLGVLPSHIIVIPEKIGLHTYPFPEQQITALRFERGRGSVTHVAHTYNLDNHPAHRINGQTIKSLYDRGSIKHAMFFVKPEFAKLNPRLFAYNVTHHVDRTALEAAINCYDHDRYKVGLISSPHAFFHLLMSPFYTVFLRAPSYSQK